MALLYSYSGFLGKTADQPENRKRRSRLDSGIDTSVGLHQVKFNDACFAGHWNNHAR
jgi:hypothetical protein